MKDAFGHCVYSIQAREEKSRLEKVKVMKFEMSSS